MTWTWDDDARCDNCQRRIAGHTNRRIATEFIVVSGWHVEGNTHLCPDHKPITETIKDIDRAIRSEVARRMSRPVKGTTIVNIRDNRRFIVAAPAETGQIAVVGTPTTPEIKFDLRPVKLQWHTYLQWHSQAADATKNMKEFKGLLRKLAGNATALTLAGRTVATFRRDGRLSLSELRKEQPEIVAKYTRRVTKLEFDEEAFLADMPEVHAAYRGESLRLTDKPDDE